MDRRASILSVPVGIRDDIWKAFKENPDDFAVFPRADDEEFVHRLALTLWWVGEWADKYFDNIPHLMAHIRADLEAYRFFVERVVL